MAATNAVLIEYLTAHGLVIEGDEKHAELWEAYRFLRAHEQQPAKEGA